MRWALLSGYPTALLWVHPPEHSPFSSPPSLTTDEFSTTSLLAGVVAICDSGAPPLYVRIIASLTYLFVLRLFLSMTALPLTREQAYQLVEKKIGVNNLLKHILAVEAGMRKLAQHFGEDVEYWGLTGLLHDLDYNETKDDEARHTYLTGDWLAEFNLPGDMLYAIHAHPGHVPCKSQLDYALFTIDPASGFLVACALMHPEKRLAALDGEFMLRRFKEKRFAAGASRENMAACENLGLEVDEFLMLVRDGMLTISDQLGL